MTYREIAEALMSNADGILKAIDGYIAKVDDDLKARLKKEGFVDEDATVEAINEVEQELAEILQVETDELEEILANNGPEDWDGLKAKVEEYFESSDIDIQIANAAKGMYQNTVQSFGTIYMSQLDSGMKISTLRNRTLAWVDSWSEELGRLMKLTSHEQLTDMIKNTIDTGNDIPSLVRMIQESGIRNEYYRARATAITEVLRAHSVAREEAIQQSPSTDRKEWVHTGSHKNKPRPNHVAMNGQIVPKEEPFELTGADGAMYYPMYPRDPVLPARETVNCHCIHRGVASDEALGLTAAQKIKLQEEYIQADNEAWKRELDAENRKKAGIEPAANNKFQDVKEEWLKSAPQKREKIKILDEFEHDGNAYKVDGKHVVLNYSKREKEVAQILNEKLGGEVKIVPEVKYPQGISTPDYIFRGERFDLKEINGAGKNILYNAIHKKEKQAHNFIFDLTNTTLESAEIEKQIDSIYSSGHTKFVDVIITVENDDVSRVYKRKNEKQ